jgi:hypothetical protein
MSETSCVDTVRDSISGRDALDCGRDSGQFTFLAISRPPTAVQITKICASERCKSIVVAIKKAQPTECLLASGVSLYKEVIDPIEAVCAEAISVNGTAGLVVPTPVIPSQTPPDTEHGLGTAEIVGIVGGVVVAILLVIVGITTFRRQRSAVDEPDRPPATDDKLDRPDGFAYLDLADTTTSKMGDAADLLSGRKGALAAMRIPSSRVQIGEVVSQGGFGEVLRGVYRNETVAVKRLLASRSHDTNNIESFVKEIELTASLDHECIVRFIGVTWDVPANLCMVSEYMQGGDLRSLLVRYAREHHANGYDDGKLRIAVHVAHALTYLHSLDTPVVHRDLKSKNILLTESLDAKLIDFGISCERQDVTMTAGVGTSLWMAPEVMQGKRYDEKADVFSFGVILSELDTHELPYDHATETESNRKMTDIVMMNLICDGKLKPRFSDMAHSQMVSIATDCLELDPARRPFASEVLYRIHRCIKNDRMLTNETRLAITRSLNTAETSTKTRSRAEALRRLPEST